MNPPPAPFELTAALLPDEALITMSLPRYVPAPMLVVVSGFDSANDSALRMSKRPPPSPVEVALITWSALLR